MASGAGKQETCDVSSLAMPGVRGLQPYLPGKPVSELERELGLSNIIKLASNENPLGCSPAARAAIKNALPDLALYPDGSGYALRQTLARHHGVDADCVTLGNGSNDLLVLLAEAFLGPERNAVYAQYAFAVYALAVQATGAPAKVARALPADAEQALGHDLEAMLGLVDENTRIVFIANPNNPTGTWLKDADLAGFLDALPGHVLALVDEAYFEYARELDVPDASQWLGKYPNLVVTRTFSKVFGLAGLRIGYSLSDPAVADMLNRIRQPFNVNSLAMCAAKAALEDKVFIHQAVTTNSAGMRQLHQGLKALGLPAAASAGNFLLVEFKGRARAVYQYLLEHGLIVRPLGNYGLGDHLRITVGTPAQNARLLEILGGMPDHATAV